MQIVHIENRDENQIEGKKEQITEIENHIEGNREQIPNIENYTERQDRYSRNRELQ